MDRIGMAGATPLQTLPNGQLGAQDENLANGTEGTWDPSLFSNCIQEELMLLLATAGITPNINNWTQILAAIRTIIGQQADYNGSASYGYFAIPAIPGNNTFIIQFGVFSVAANQGSVQQILPVAFAHTFLGGLAGDGGSQAYGYGVAVGEDLAHVTIDCPEVQIINGELQARPGVGAGFFLAWGY